MQSRNSSNIGIRGPRPPPGSGTFIDDGGEYIWFPNPDGFGPPIKAYINSGIQPIPEPPGSANDIHFLLYTQQNPNSPQEIFVGDKNSVDNSKFDKTLPIKIIAHGFGGSYLSGCPKTLWEAYIQPQVRPLNVIVIDWEKLAEEPYYFYAADNTKVVGERAAQLIDFLVKEGYTTLEEVHFIVHSLGAHVAGVVGYSVTGGKIKRVTGLDPSLSLFKLLRTNADKLDPSDGQFVDVMNTTGPPIAFEKPRGHVDFYPNGGSDQSNCGEFVDSITCSHARTCIYFAESILGSNSSPFTRFTYCKCSSWDEFKGNGSAKFELPCVNMLIQGLSVGF